MQTGSGLCCDVRPVEGCLLVRPSGVLDVANYASLRNTLLKCAVEQPRAVVVDLADLEVRGEYLLSVFAAVWLRTCDWPSVPLLLAGPVEQLPRVTALRRYVTVHDTVDEALAHVGRPAPRRRAHRVLPSATGSPRAARAFVREVCVDWSVPEAVKHTAVQVASELVTNTVLHTMSEARLRLELRGAGLTVAVADDDPAAAVLRDPGGAPQRGAGLLLVAQLARTWGCVPDPVNGRKVVWAVLDATAG
ncbi:ATP-binding protein [Saccharothrix xinjiangensis]|uniref:ATP-binding protein n=1 Tax=Saccharothrix xinjiangensis TaxID=204798 RepID=A0ABV9Y0K5_9PSEU